MFSKDKILPLLKKYDVPVPRYTSYPTVPAWGSAVGEGDYRTSLAALTEDEKLSLYFHIPFCESLCHFCGCTQVITKDHARSKPYVESLLAEVDEVVRQLKNEKHPVSQFHFGGGTPNFLLPEELSEIVEQVRESFKLLPDAEIAIEMHPKTSTDVFCRKLRELGFNRISLGVQDFDPLVQSLINRNQTHEMTEKMVVTLRGLGFDSFNFDLVYGLPGQTLDGWRDTLDKVVALRPNRIAVYSYAHVPWVRPVQRSFADTDLPPASMKVELFGRAVETFTKNGWRLIGIDHFALEDDELCHALDCGTIHRNFMGYSTRSDAHQLGFGMSAISYAAGNYFQNEKDARKYQQKISEGCLPVFRGMMLSHEDALRRDLIMRLMCRGRLNVREFGKKWAISFDSHFQQEKNNLQEFVEDQLLIVTQDEMKATPAGYLFLRNMAACFDAYIEGVRRDSKTPVFSRAV